MKNKDNHRDAFEEIFREKMENHSMPVDEKLWEGIEKRLPRKRRPFAGLYWLGGSVAAGLAILFTFNIFQKSGDENLARNSQKETVKSVLSTAKSDSLKDNVIILNNQNDLSKVKEKEIYSRRIKKQHKNSTQYTNQTASDAATTDANFSASEAKTSDNQFNGFDFGQVGKEVTANNANSDLRQKDSIPAKQYAENKITSLPPLPEETAPEETPDEPKNHSWFLAATAGAADGLPKSTKSEMDFRSAPTAELAYGASAAKLSSQNNAYIMSPKDFNNIRHLPPVSFSVTVQKNITHNISVETGLTYTYLRSVFSSETNWQKANATLDLHYLGIPVDFIFLIADKRQWSYYFSAGGMLEKGLRSIYKQTISTNVERNTDVYSKIDGFQSSVHAAFGVDYNLSKHYSIFVEPKMSYYLKNNQPMSARTENPLIVGVNGGLKIKL